MNSFYRKLKENIDKVEVGDSVVFKSKITKTVIAIVPCNRKANLDPYFCQVVCNRMFLLEGNKIPTCHCNSCKGFCYDVIKSDFITKEDFTI